MSADAVILRAGGSHLYPGARGTLAAPAPAAPVPCLVEFVDGAAATGTLTPAGDGAVLETAAYTTARGTRIPGKRWLVELAARGFRVRRRA